MGYAILHRYKSREIEAWNGRTAGLGTMDRGKGQF